MKALIIFLSIYCSAAIAETTDSLSARQQLEAFSQNMVSFTAGFSQQIRSANGRLEEPETGQFKLLRPNFFRWDYAGEYPQQIVGDGQQVWIYDIELEQVSVKPQAQNVSESPVLVLLQPENLDKFFTVTELGVDTDGAAMIALVPINPETTFERIIVTLKNSLPQLLILEDGFGQRTELSFIGQQLNPEIAADQFVFFAPEGTDVIGAALP